MQKFKLNVVDANTGEVVSLLDVFAKDESDLKQKMTALNSHVRGGFFHTQSQPEPPKTYIHIVEYYTNNTLVKESVSSLGTITEENIDEYWSKVLQKGSDNGHLSIGKYSIVTKCVRHYDYCIEKLVQNNSESQIDEKSDYKKYTPAPWTYSLTGIKNQRGQLIAQAWCGDNNESCGNHPAVGYSEMIANNYLIAAAPELLESLEDVVKLLNIYSNTTEPSLNNAGSVDAEIYKNAVKVIKKAKK